MFLFLAAVTLHLFVVPIVLLHTQCPEPLLKQLDLPSTKTGGKRKARCRGQNQGPWSLQWTAQLDANYSQGLIFGQKVEETPFFHSITCLSPRLQATPREKRSKTCQNRSTFTRPVANKKNTGYSTIACLH